MPPPATTDELFELIGRSGLLTPDAARQYLPPPGRLVNSEVILTRMTRDGVITPFHAKHLAAGRYKGFFLNDKYKMLAHLGAGGIGHVYLCEHLLLHRLVAVKILQATAVGESAGAVERFFREARAVAMLDHPNVVRVFDMDRAGNLPFMVIEYVDGTNLHAVVASGGPMPVVRAANYARQAALGLEYVRRQGLIHRDIKPGNLLVDRAGVVKLLDLGLARFFTDTARNNNLTAQFDNNTVVGTADFIAPEQTQDSSSVDIRADIYSLGGTLYYFLAGRSPFEHGTLAQKLLWHQMLEPPPIGNYRQGVPEGLLAVVAKMLAKKPEDRYQTPADVAAALAPWGAQDIPPPAPVEMPPMPASSYRLGLSPPPSGSLTRSGPIPVIDPPSTNSKAGQPTAQLEEPQTPRRRVRGPDPDGTINAPTIGDHRPPADADDSHDHPDRRRLLIGVVAASVLVTVAFGLWLLLAGKRGTPVVLPPSNVGPAVPLAIGGSTFAQKAMTVWAEDYAPNGKAKFDPPYDGVGSGKGVEGLKSGKYHIAFTDKYLTETELTDARAAGKEYVHIPLVVGAVVPTYNLPGLKEPLKFNGPVLADIYLGKITRWDHDALALCNRGVALPDKPITVVYRSDASGTTAIWTEFLSAKSGDWKEQMGAVRTEYKTWRTGTGAERNEGVAEAVTQTVGAIGYVELTYALEKNLSVGAVANGAQKYVFPSLESVTAAAAAAANRSKLDLRFTLIDTPGDKSYPIAGTTWAVFDAKHPDPSRRKAVAEFLSWATHDGQKSVGSLRYAPLPAEIVAAVETKLRPLTGE